MRRMFLALLLAVGIVTAVSVPAASAQTLVPVAPSGPWQPVATPFGPAWALFDLTGRLVTVLPATVLPPPITAPAPYPYPAPASAALLTSTANTYPTALPYMFGAPQYSQGLASPTTYGVQSSSGCTCGQ